MLCLFVDSPASPLNLCLGNQYGLKGFWYISGAPADGYEMVHISVFTKKSLFNTNPQCSGTIIVKFMI